MTDQKEPTSTRKAEEARLSFRLYLALSGGGFRATAHHCGALLAFIYSGAVWNISVINSVSGGAVAGGGHPSAP